MLRKLSRSAVALSDGSQAFSDWRFRCAEFGNSVEKRTERAYQWAASRSVESGNSGARPSLPPSRLAQLIWRKIKGPLAAVRMIVISFRDYRG
jgi:hypothetical protein